MTLSKFRKRYDGKSVDSGQCVALARRWLVEGLGFKNPYVIPSVTGAKEMFAKAPRSKFRKVKRKRGVNFPPNGALVIFDGHAGNVYGHVAIARSRCTKHRLLTFDQNWSSYRRCSDEEHRYERDNVIGWLIKR